MCQDLSVSHREDLSTSIQADGHPDPQAAAVFMEYSQWPRHGATEVSISRGLDKDDVVHVYNGILLGHKKR